MGRYVIVRDKDHALMRSCAHSKLWTQDLGRAKVFESLAEARSIAGRGEHAVSVERLVAEGRQAKD